MIEQLSIREPVEIVICNTGIVANTKAMVAGVAERKKQNPTKYGGLFSQAEKLAQKGRKALEEFDLQQVGYPGRQMPHPSAHRQIFQR